jgi:DNA adenine methylase
MNNKSPLRYPGGKTKACAILDTVLRNHINIRSYAALVSPFFGGGSFEFHMQNKYNLRLIVNDAFTPLFIFWRVLKSSREELVESVRDLHPVSKEQFLTYRSEIMDLSRTDSLRTAAYYFVINRCSFSGATLSGGFSEQASRGRFNESSITKLGAVDLSCTTIRNEDFEQFLTGIVGRMETRKRQKVIIFLDPPYYLEGGSKLYGKNGDMHESFDHERLARTLESYRDCTWMMTYNDCEYIRDLYEEYTMIDGDDASWSYGMNASKKSSEIIILNIPQG